MTDEIKNPGSRVDRSANGKFHAIWRGQLVYMSGRIKEFEAERDAWEYLARCDAEGRILERNVREARWRGRALEQRATLLGHSYG